MNRILFIVFILLSLHGLSQEYVPVPKKKDFKDFKLNPGVVETAFRMTDGSSWDVMISVPQKITSNTGLIIALHWGVSMNKYEEFMQCLVLPAVDTSQYIVLAPRSDRQAWWWETKEKQTAKLIFYANQFLPHKNTIVLGYSDGGTGAAYFASKYPHLVDGAVAIAGNYLPADQYDVPLYVAHGTNDELFEFSKAQTKINESKANSQHVVFIAAEGYSHYEGCNYTTFLSEGIEWVNDRLN